MQHMKPLTEEQKETILQRFELNFDGQLVVKERHRAGCLGWREPGHVVEGAFNNWGYKLLSVKGKLLKVHRVVYFLAHGEDPHPKLIDHIDMDRSNNHPDNLRLCSQSQNMRNSSTRLDNTSGYKGVYWEKSAQKWRVRVGHKGEKYHGGLFDDKEQANLAATALREKLHGDFARHE